ncbi:MAG: LysR substrate-binding domain-containing protein [Burkholderiales bacterium]
MAFFSVDMRVLRSFLSVVETGNITETARRLGRTQPAITLQMKRLEDLTGRTRFDPESRKPVLTEEGKMVLTYAKSILRLHDERLARLSATDIEGHVVLGTPDLYAAYLLLSILALFRKSFPRIRVELRCARSTPWGELVQRGQVDIALVTRMPGFSGGEVVGQHQLVRVAGEGHDVHLEEPVPLALLPPGNIHRDYAIEGMERAGRKWRIACESERAGRAQRRDDSRIGGGHEVLERRRAPVRRRAFDEDEVLDGDGHAGQRSGRLAAQPRRRRNLRGRPGRVDHRRDHDVAARLRRRQRIDDFLDDFRRREAAVAVTGQPFAGRQSGERPDRPRRFLRGRVDVVHPAALPDVAIRATARRARTPMRFAR